MPITAGTLLAADTPLFIVLNTGSGSHRGNEVEDSIRRVLDEAERRYELFKVGSGSDLENAARQALQRARSEGGAVIAAGGDGTLNAVSNVVLGADVPFGILPQGTFNYFGRTYGISQDTETATRSLLDSVVEPVQVGQLNGHVFLVNASLGLYPNLLDIC